MIKKTPIAIIQDSIQEEEKKLYFESIQKYTNLVVICCVLNIILIILFLRQDTPVTFQEIDIDEEVFFELDDSIEKVNKLTQELEKKVQSSKQNNVTFLKKTNNDIRLIMKHLFEIDKNIDLAEEKILEIRKKVVKSK